MNESGEPVGVGAREVVPAANLYLPNNLSQAIRSISSAGSFIDMTLEQPLNAQAVASLPETSKVDGSGPVRVLSVSEDHRSLRLECDGLDTKPSHTLSLEVGGATLSMPFVHLPEGNGVLGTYNSAAWKQGKVAKRTDAAIDFDWKDSGPVELPNGMGPNWFRVQWQGWLRIERAGDYTFGIELAPKDAVDLYVDGVRLINFGSGADKPSYSRESQPIHLDAGAIVPIFVTYREEEAAAKIRLTWRVSGAEPEVVPTKNLYTDERLGVRSSANVDMQMMP